MLYRLSLRQQPPAKTRVFTFDWTFLTPFPAPSAVDSFDLVLRVSLEVSNETPPGATISSMTKSAGIQSDPVGYRNFREFHMLRTATILASRGASAQTAVDDRGKMPLSGRIQSIDIVRGAVMLL